MQFVIFLFPAEEISISEIINQYYWQEENKEGWVWQGISIQTWQKVSKILYVEIFVRFLFSRWMDMKMQNKLLQ